MDKETQIAQEILALKPKWPYSERQKFAIENNYNAETLRRNFMMGSITNLPVAEKLLETMKSYKA